MEKLKNLLEMIFNLFKKDDIPFRKLLNTNNWFNYKRFYKKITKEKEYKVFVEIGSWKGHSTRYLGKLLKDRDIVIYAIDLFDMTYKEYDSIEKKYLFEIFNYNIRRLNNIEPIKSISWEASEKFNNASVDFVFIDADHTYSSVKKDIESWLPKVKKGGIISGHDYFNPCGVKQAVDEIFSDKVEFYDKCWFVRI
jgi:predicted O-methyltransferase YrrM